MSRTRPKTVAALERALRRFDELTEVRLAPPAAEPTEAWWEACTELRDAASDALPCLLADHRDHTDEVSRLRALCHRAADEIEAHAEAHLDAEGAGPVTLIRALRGGPVEYRDPRPSEVESMRMAAELRQAVAAYCAAVRRQENEAVTLSALARVAGESLMREGRWPEDEDETRGHEGP